MFSSRRPPLPLLTAVLFLLISAVLPASAQELSLLGRFETNVFDEGAAEIAAYDATSGLVVFVNADANQVVGLDLASPGNPAEAFTINVESQVSGGSANSVDVFDGTVAVAVESATSTDPGSVVFYDITGASPSFLGEAAVGSLPDGLAFSPDGSTVVVANEGEPSEDYSVDPDGSVSVIDVSGGFSSPSVTTVGFSGFDAATLIGNGVRIFGGVEPLAVTGFTDTDPATITVSDLGSAADGQWLTLTSDEDPIAYQIASLDAATNTITLTTDFDGDTELNENLGPANLYTGDATAAQDLEPEFVTISPDGSTAYVTLQENNALAVVDLSVPEISDVVALGSKDHTVTSTGGTLDGIALSNALDASNEDGIDIRTAPVRGLYQPDAIAAFEIDGTPYLITANEGDAREYDALVEEVDVEDLPLDPTAYPDASVLQGEDEIGPLTSTYTIGDTDQDGDIDQLYSFGARSFTIWDASANVVFDSGDFLEQKTADIFPGNFNSNNDENFSFDDRSDNKGPEPEAVTVATASDGTPYAFVGLERIGGVMVFDLTDPTAPAFVQYVNARDFGVLDVEGSVRGDGAVGDLGPESIVFIPAADNPNSQDDLVLVSNEVSGTVSIFRFGQPQTVTLQLLHASDLEGNINAVGDDRGMMDPNRGDAPRFSGVINTLREAFVNTIVVSSGDNVIPGPLFNASGDGSLSEIDNYEPSPGRADIFFMNEIGFTASALGNHEFDQGPDRLASLLEPDDAYPGTTFPYLSANVDVSGDGALSGFAVPGAQPPQPNSIAPSVIANVNGEPVGLIGLTTENLADVSSPGPDITIDDQLADAVNSAAQALTDAGVNKIILISHLQQFSAERNLAADLENVDIIIAGGSARLLADDEDISRDGGSALYGSDTREDDYPLIEQDASGDDVLIVSADGQYRYVGRLVVEFDPNGNLVEQNVDFDGTTYRYTDPTVSGAFSSEREDLLNLTGAGSIGDLLTDDTIDPDVESLAAEIAGILSQKLAATFGATDQFLNGIREEVRTEQTNFGDLTADANLSYAQAVSGQADVVGSIKNGGGIRAPIGEIDPDTGDRLVPQEIPGTRQEGEVSQLDIEASLSFNNSLAVLTLTVEQIKEALENGVSGLPEIDGRFPQIGGLTFEFDPSYPVGERIRMAQVDDDNGAETGGAADVFVMDGEIQGDASRSYKIVTLGFLADGNDGYNVFAEAANRLDLDEQGLADDLLGGDGATGIGAPGREQDALAEFLAATSDLQNPYTNADTEPADDDRIVNLPAAGGTRGLRAWINEFHYDDDGADENEFVEVVVDSDLADLENLEVVLYNGSNGEVYDSESVDGFDPGSELPPFGFTIYSFDFTADSRSIQNGGPDGLALCYRGEVVSSGGAPLFLSYEGTFDAVDGCAQGRTSTDIGVAEESSTPAGTSLSLVADGATYADLISGSWQAGVSATPGTLNDGQTALPVELASFSGASTDRGVTLAWTTAAEEGNAGFQIEHRPPGAEGFDVAGFEPGAGTTSEAVRYQFLVPGTEPGRHAFRLRQIDTDGTEALSETIEVRVDLDGPFALSEVYPNPVRGRAVLNLRVREAQDVTATVYNLLGQQVSVLHSGTVTADRPLELRLKGSRLSSGVYFVRVDGERFRTVRKLMVVR